MQCSRFLHLSPVMGDSIVSCRIYRYSGLRYTWARGVKPCASHRIGQLLKKALWAEGNKMEKFLEHMAAKMDGHMVHFGGKLFHLLAPVLRTDIRKSGPVTF